MLGLGGRHVFVAPEDLLLTVPFSLPHASVPERSVSLEMLNLLLLLFQKTPLLSYGLLQGCMAVFELSSAKLWISASGGLMLLP